MGKGSNNTTTTTAPNSQAMQSYQDLLARAQGVSNTPYTPFGGEMVAPVNAQQNTGIANINSNAGFAMPYIQTAGGMAYNAAQPITGQQIQQYSNPFTDQVVNATQNQFNNQNQQQQQKLLGNGIMRGSLGGNRTGIAQAELANQQNLAQAPVLAGLRSQGYTTGLNTALQEQQAQQSGAYSLGNLGVAGQSAALTGANAQIGAGTLQQGTQQAQDAANYQQYMQKMGYPFQTAQWLAGIATGVGSQMGGTSSTQGPQPSGWSQALGGLGTGVGALGASGAFGAAGWLTPALACLATGGAAPEPEGIANQETYNTVPESHATLSHQQHQLMRGHRKVQMFPHGTPELQLPPGMERTVVGRDVFHHDPHQISSHEIRHHAAQGHEHKLLDLGHFSKHEILHRLRGGEIPVAVVERHPDGSEVRSAAGTHVTAPHQLAAMHRTKSPGHTLSVEDPHQVLSERMRACGGIVRAAGGGVAGDMSGMGVAGGMPWGSTGGWIPGIGITGGRGAPTPPTLPGSKPDDFATQGKQLGQLAGAIHDSFSKKKPDSMGGGLAEDAMSGTDGSGLAPSYDDVGTPVGDFGPIGPRARGGGVAGYLSGGAPSDDDGSLNPSNWLGWETNDPVTGEPQGGTFPSIKDAPSVVPSGVAPGRPAALSRMAENDPDALPGKADTPFAPARRSSLPADALSYSGDAPPRAFSGTKSPAAAGIAPPESAENTGVDWSEKGKLWPSLMSAGLAMMASKSPNVGVAFGEGGLEGMKTYSGLKTQEMNQAMNQAKIDQAAKKLAQDADIAQKNFQLKSLPYQGGMTAAQKAAEDRQARGEMRLEMAPVKLGTDIMGRDIFGVRDPASGGFRRIDPATGEVGPPVGGSIKPLPGSPSLQPPMSGNPTLGAPASSPGRNPATPGGVTNAGFTQISDEPLPGNLEPPPEPSTKDEDYLKEVAGQDPRLAQTVKGLANYEINPTSLSIRGNRREQVLGMAKLYDPTYDQTLYPAKQRAVTEFFAGGPMSPAGTLTAGNTAILHLAEMNDMVDKLHGQPGAINRATDYLSAQGLPFVSYWANQLHNRAVQGTPEGAAVTDFLTARQRFTEEVTKFYSGAAGSEAERDRAIQLLDTAKSPEELHSAIRTDLKLMRDKVDQMQGRLITAMGPSSWKQAVKRDPSLILTYKNSRDASDKILKGGTPTAGAPAAPGAPPTAPRIAPAERFKQLIDGGLSKPDAYSKMHSEGY